MITRWYLQKQLTELLSATQGRFGVASVPALLAAAQCKRLIFTSSRIFYAGSPVVNQFFAVEDQTLATKERVLVAAGSLAAASGSSMHAAVMRAALEAGLPIREIETEQAGETGVIGRLDRAWLVFGDQEAMQSEQIEIGVSVQTLAHQFEKDGKYVLFLAQKTPKRLLGIFACSYPLLPGATEVIHQLETIGLEIVLLSGARTAQVKGVIRQLGVSLAHSELDFEEKQEIIHDLCVQQPASGVVAFTQDEFVAPVKFLATPAPDATSELWFTDLQALPELLQATRDVVRQTRRRFFWAKLVR